MMASTPKTLDHFRECVQSIYGIYGISDSLMPIELTTGYHPHDPEGTIGVSPG